jgi:hypothetical protein
LETEELIRQIRADVRAVRDQGQQVIDATALDSYLGELEETASLTRDEQAWAHESQIEDFKARHQSNLAHYGAQNQAALEMLRTLVAVGQAALRTPMLINGGAAVAILGFLRNAWTKNLPSAVLKTLPSALLLFTAGVLAAALASGFAHLAQQAVTSHREQIAKRLRWLVIALVLVSYLLFCYGGWEAYVGFVRAGA